MPDEWSPVILARSIRTFWAPVEAVMPRVLVVEAAPVILLIAACLILTVQGAPLLRYTDAAAQSLHMPSNYIGRVLPSAAPDDEAGEAGL